MFRKTSLLILCSSLFILGSFAQSSTSWTVDYDTANVFSSPRFTDLNNDGIKDMVVGAGVESVQSSNGVLAIDGNNGELIWKIASRTQVYTSALFQDITDDGVDDVFIGGRAAVYFAINGATGEIIWEFFKGTDAESRKAGFLNFFGAQFIEDQDGDGFEDLLVTNGGDYIAAPQDRSRSTARLMILSAATGKILNKVAVSDGRESYYAPHVFYKKNKPVILFGTGGETIEGAFYELPLKSLTKNSMKKVRTVLSDTSKGFILNSVVADLNMDGQADIINARMNAIVSAVDGKTGSVIWEQAFKNKECYVTPSLGMFNQDDVPDVFTIIATGTFPMYSEFEIVVMDGVNGDFLYREVTGFNQFSPAISADLNEDGVEEVIYIENKLADPSTFQLENQVRVIDVKNKQTYMLGDVRSGISMASSPAILDVDNDGNFELFVISATLPMSPEVQPKSSIQRIDLNKSVDQISWPGYLGQNENGSFE